MNLKIFLICVLVVQVKCNFDGLFEKIRNRAGMRFFTNLFTPSSEPRSDYNIDDDGGGIGFGQLFADVSSLVADEIMQVFNVENQADAYEEVPNRFKIHSRAYSLSDKEDNEENKNNKQAKKGIIIKNLTVFNDELNDLKIELEKNLQQEIDTFIAQVLENDTVDWVKNTRRAMDDNSFTTTEKPYPDFEEALEIATQLFKNNNNILNEKVNYASNVDDIEISTENSISETTTLLEDGYPLNMVTSESSQTDVSEKSTERIEDKTTIKPKIDLIPVSIIMHHDRNSTNTTVDQLINIKSLVKPTEAVETQHNNTTTAKAEDRSENNYNAVEIQNNLTTTTNPFTTAKAKAEARSEINYDAVEDNYSTTTNIPTTAKNIDRKEVESRLGGNKKAVEKQDNQTTTTNPPTKAKDVDKKNAEARSGINYKLLQNFKDNEINSATGDLSDIPDDNNTDYPGIDYVELYKDTTNEDVEYVTPTVATESVARSDEPKKKDEFTCGVNTKEPSNPAYIFQSIAAIFIKNTTTRHFEYYCDGALLSNTVILTAARCLQKLNETVDPNTVLIFLGKRSLQSSGEGETILKVKSITIHPDFFVQDDKARNDLAILSLDEPAVYNDGIRPACLLEEGEIEDAVTTAWSAVSCHGTNKISGIHFVEKNITCEQPVENTFCATIGSAVAVCPSYGGLYAAKKGSTWCIGGIRTADPSNKGLCFDKTIAYTNLKRYRTWIDENMK